jgi:hypothetical protein
MNIFEYLGLPAGHRKKDKVTMKVKHYDEVPDSMKPRRAVYYGQIKKDGIYCHVVKWLGVSLFSRTGMALTNTDHMIKQLELWGDKMPDGVYLTELCCDSCSIEALSGIYNPNRVKPLDENQEQWKRDSYLSFHDYLTIDEFIRGVSNADYSSRYLKLQSILPLELSLLDVDMVHIDDIHDFAKFYIDNGEEGIVIKRAFERWEAGHKGYKQMKIVKGVDYDLECIGAEEGTGKYAGKIANLIFRWKNGQEVKAMLGKGWSHNDAEWLYRCWSAGESINGTPESVGSPIGKIYHVHALQESSKGKLRLPKVCECRIDKEIADV